MSRKRNIVVFQGEESMHDSKHCSIEMTDNSGSPSPIPYDEPFICGIDGCEASFSSEQEYEIHYSLYHRFVCSRCNKRLLSDHLLTMHVMEKHDTLFKLMNQRYPMYQCYVRSCNRRFSSREERNQHAVQDHFFPNTSPILETDDLHDKEIEEVYQYLLISHIGNQNG